MQRLLSALVLCLGLSTQAADPDQYLFLSCSGDKRVDSYLIDPETGDLTLKQSVPIEGGAGPICESPNKYRLYVSNRNGRQAGITTLKLETSGKLTSLGNAPVEDYAGYLTTDATGRFLMGSHYSQGKVSVWKINHGRATSELNDFELPGDKAHSVMINQRNNFVYVPHTGPNKVSQFRFDSKTGKLAPNTPAFVAGPKDDADMHQPRHILLHPVLDYAYTSNERSGGISAWDYNPNNGNLKLMQTLTTLPKDYDWKSAAADIQITPNGKFVYVSNRDGTDRNAIKGKDTIAAFSINQKTGKLKPAGSFPTVHVPRSFTIDETGNYLYSAGQYSAQLAAYRIDPNTGALTLLKTYKVGATPMWAKAMYLPKP